MYELLVGLALLSTAMLLGLLFTLLTVMRPLWNRQSERAAAESFQLFLKTATVNPLLSAFSVIPLICTIVIIFVGAPDSGKYALVLTGGGVFFVGFFLCTALVNAPIYKSVMTWDPSTSPAAVSALRARFHTMNLVRLAAALTTSVLLYLAA